MTDRTRELFTQWEKDLPVTERSRYAAFKAGVALASSAQGTESAEGPVDVLPICKFCGHDIESAEQLCPAAADPNARPEPCIPAETPKKDAL